MNLLKLNAGKPDGRKYVQRQIQERRLLDHKNGRNYNVSMKARIVKIGNSQGIRIPKLLLERSKLNDEVELEAREHQIIIRSAKQPRQDWANEFRIMAERGDDELLDKDLHAQTQWDEDEWQW